MVKRKKKIVVDSSVIVKWVNTQGEGDLEKADKLLKDCEEGKVSLIAPELAKYEAGNAVLYKGMDLPKTKMSLATIASMPIRFVCQSHEDLGKILETAYTTKVTFYDASFVVLAMKEKAVLVSANPKHHRSFKFVRVVNLRDY